MLKQSFTSHLNLNNLEGSNKAPSYLKAIEWLHEMLKIAPLGFDDCKNIWELTSVDRLSKLYNLILEQRKLKENSPWVVNSIPSSYLKKGFCSAAVRAYLEFLVEDSYLKNLTTGILKTSLDENSLVSESDYKFTYPKEIEDEKINNEGKDVIRETKTRLNQGAFRRVILEIYNQSCCITGLDIPELNRASHIVGWAEDKAIRLDARNGLCLSATYDAAFDRHLISLDEDYRLILSKDIKDHYTSKSSKEHFLNREGIKINLPHTFQPNLDYLERHRKQGNF